MSKTYIYPYYDGVKIPDTTDLTYKDGKVIVNMFVSEDLFANWFVNAPKVAELELKADNLGGILIKRFPSLMEMTVTGVESPMYEHTYVTLSFEALELAEMNID